MRLRDALEQERREKARRVSRNSGEHWSKGSQLGLAADRRSKHKREGEPGRHRQAEQDRGVR
ncbi:MULTISPECIES: hypothetical protein [Bradyrhizobium]|jgi:hypothetical protein|uniref:hypothetical protein n=1 Tax=Bradyrhizobium TaxID=374 RepID=UPI00293F75F4|nr:hypothetical protein [Bradyrhizobium sp. NDS-1]WOH76677.1 hypothetical protein RX330_16905 [Bradyrhizobium sp. NDS-1]